MTDIQKIRDYLKWYLEQNSEDARSKSLVKYMLMIMGDPNNPQLPYMFQFLMEKLDEVKIEYERLVENNCTPPPIVIAPETEEGKRLLKTILEMKKEEEK